MLRNHFPPYHIRTTIASPQHQQLNYLTGGGDGSSHQVQVDRMSTSCLRSNRRFGFPVGLRRVGGTGKLFQFVDPFGKTYHPLTIGPAQPSTSIEQWGANFKL